MSIKKLLKPEEYSEARKKALDEKMKLAIEKQRRNLRTNIINCSQSTKDENLLKYIGDKNENKKN